MTNDATPDDSGSSILDDLGRRELLQALTALGLASAAGGGAWAFLEATLPRGRVESWSKSVCRYCGTGCGVLVGTATEAESGRPEVLEVRGDPEAHNEGRLCIKGTLLPLLMKAPGRLLHPQIRENGSLRRASWDEAMDLVARRFREAIDAHGPDAVAFYGSGQLYTEESYTANKLFKAGIGTNNVDPNARLCMASAAVGYTKTYGKDEPAGSYEDIDHASVFFLIGANMAECHQPLFERIKARRASDPSVRVICVDPRRTKTAERSDLHLAPRPGSDLLLLWAMIQALDEADLLARAFIDEHVGFVGADGPADFPALRAFLADYTPEAVAAQVGVTAAQIREAAVLFAESPATMSFWTMGLNQRVDGTALNTTINALHLLTGQIGRPGATPMSLTGQCNACGGIRDSGSLAHLLPHGRLVANAEHRAEIEDLWGVPAGTLSPEPGLHAVGLFEAMTRGDVKCALTMCTNPAQSIPNLDRYERGMDDAFLVVADAFEDTRTNAFADVVLPAALWVEKEGVLGQSERRYQLVEKLLDAPGEARSDLEILVDLAGRLGHGDLIGAKTAEAVWEEYRELSSHSLYDFSGMTRERLRRERGLQWPCPDEDHPGTVRRYAEGDPFVEEGRATHFYGQGDGRAKVHLTPYEARADMPDAEYPLVLNTGRILEQWHTGTMTDRIPELRDGSPRGHFVLHPYDAAARGIADGDRILVESRYGRLSGPCRVRPEPSTGTLFAHFYDASFPINRVVTDNVDPISKEPDYKTTAVRVRREG
ncbi:MAG: nitrate reductase [Planctomycetota bacterium]